MSDTQQETTEVWNSSFYSSSSINSVDHIKNFRNSLVLNELPQNEDIDEANDQGFSSEYDSSIFFEDSNLQSNSGVRSNGLRSTSKDLTESAETETTTMNMTASPSLSALAGILNEKSKQADRKIRSSMILQNSIVEESDEEPEDQEQEVIDITHDLFDHRNSEKVFQSNSNNELPLINQSLQNVLNLENEAIGSPNLIDFNDNHKNATFPLTMNKQINNLIYEQPDFLSSPNLNITSQQTQIPSTKPLISSKQQNYNASVENISSENINSDISQVQSALDRSSPAKSDFSQNTLIETKQSSPIRNHPNVETKKIEVAKSNHPIVKEVHKELDTNSGRSTPTKRISKKLEKKVVPLKKQEPITTSNKKKSIFSFLKKKTPKEKDVEKNSLTKSRSISMNSSHNDTTPVKLYKKSSSSSSIFNNFKKNKDAKDSGTLNIGKVRSKGKNENSSPKKPLQRKPTPLDFEKELNNIIEDTSNANSYDDNVYKSPNKTPDLLSSDKIINSTFDSGMSLFPKSLDSKEVESIISLERSRSLKSKRNSTASQRKSLNESLSINAKNEGMYISEPSKIILSTPDLSKSPASSILRNGKFNSSESPSYLLDFDDNEEDEQSKLEHSHANEFSFGSFEKQMNSLIVNSDSEDNNETSPYIHNKINTDLVPDEELMTDIMEFANIINFGDDLDFNFDVSSGKDQTTQAYNAPHKTTCIPKPQDVPVIAIEDENSYMSEYQGINDSPTQGSNVQKYQNMNNMVSFNSQSLPNSSEPYKENETTFHSYEHDFDNENFNDLEESLNSPLQNKINAYLPDSATNGNRPISMSFRGLSISNNEDLQETTKYNNSSFFSESDTTHSSYLRGKSRLQFSTKIILYETYGQDEYDRTPDIAACNQLTPQLAQMIKIELNELKSEMEIHQDSKCYTHFY